jgi:PPOX class probable F420-dependent enzyme
MASALDSPMLSFVAENTRGVLATIGPDGRPQLSNLFYWFDPTAGLVRISTAEERAKIRNLRRDPRVSLHVTSPDFWTWVAVEGTADLSRVAADPHDATVEELIGYFRATGGEHPDWDEFRRAMVTERRLVIRFRPERTYGQLPG